MDGVYRCEIPDTRNVIQTIYIGVYSTNTGEWYVYTLVTVYTCNKRAGQHVKIFVHVWGVNVLTERTSNLLIYHFSGVDKVIYTD